MEAQFKNYRDQIENALRQFLRSGESLEEAMGYTVFLGGKRLRPVLTLAFCRLCGGDPETALPFACSVEMVHSYSLIHDDLPAMDNDSLRRGQPTNHVVYGEAMAILAGDALLTKAFELLAAEGKNGSEEIGQDNAAGSCAGQALSPCQRVTAMKILSQKIGAKGMVGGQSMDLMLQNERGNPNHAQGISLVERIQEMERLKTAALISAACQLGCVAAMPGETDPEKLTAAEAYAQNLGLAFQVRDDILGIIGDSKVLGKTVGLDAQTHKQSYALTYGVSKAQEKVEHCTFAAKEALKVFGGDTAFLAWIADTMAVRSK